MITTKELNMINKDYFHVIQANAFSIYLQSKNTKHFWGILIAEYPNFRNFQIYHKHNQHDSYHRHKDAPTLFVALEGIKGHDEFQMNGRKSGENANKGDYRGIELR